MFMEKMMEKLFSLKKMIILIIIFHPAALLLSIGRQFRLFEMGNTSGTILLGVLFGCFLYTIFKKLNLNVEIKSFTGILFLASPYMFYALVLMNINFNLALFWLGFIFIYLITGVAIFIKSSANIENKTELYVTSLVIVYLILALMVNFINIGVVYSPDSYSYYDISKTIFSNFGMVNIIRQYTFFSELGISFPYLFPAMISIVNMLTGFSIYSGNIINLVATLMSVYFLMKISYKLTKSSYPGLIASALMLFNPDFLDELMSARAVPLSILCVLLILNVIVHSEALAVIPQESENQKLKNNFEKLIWKKSAACDLFLIGLFAGAGMVIRFDFLAIAGLLGVILSIIFLLKKNIFKTIPFYALGLLIFSLPWIIFSIVNFQLLWVSDNSGTMFLVSPVSPRSFFTPGEYLPTFFTDRAAWITSRKIIFITRLSDLIYIITRPVGMIVLLGVTALGILSGLTNKDKNQELKGLRALLVCIVIIYITKSLAIYLVGYGDLRYHSETVIIVFFVIVCNIAKINPKPFLWSRFIALVCFVSLISNVQPTINALRPRLISPFVDLDRILPLKSTQELERLLMAHGQYKNGHDVRFLNLGGLNVDEFGAHSGILTFGVLNLNEARLLYVVDNFIHPNYVFANDEFNNWVAVLSRYYLFNRVGESHAFALTPLDNFTRNGSIKASNLTDDNWNNGLHRSLQVILLENTTENIEAMKNAVGIMAGGVSVGIVSIMELGQWIQLTTETTVNLENFAYPNIITILQYNKDILPP